MVLFSIFIQRRKVDDTCLVFQCFNFSVQSISITFYPNPDYSVKVLNMLVICMDDIVKFRTYLSDKCIIGFLNDISFCLLNLYNVCFFLILNA